MRLIDWALQVAPDHPALAGHFPGVPIVPGVLLLDEAVHALERELNTAGGGATILEIQSVKFHRPLRPHETLQLRYEARADGTVQFELLCGDARVVTGMLSLGTTAPS